MSPMGHRRRLWAGRLPGRLWGRLLSGGFLLWAGCESGLGVSIPFVNETAEEDFNLKACKDAGPELDAARDISDRVFSDACTKRKFECCIREEEDCMVYVPPGTYVAGEFSDRKLGYLGGFYIEKYEVTNGRYGECENQAMCSPPSSTGFFTTSSYYRNPKYARHPVLNIDFGQGRQYCQWKGRRLPKKAEWEKAARGPADGPLVGLPSASCLDPPSDESCNVRPFPWGGHVLQGCIRNDATCRFGNFTRSFRGRRPGDQPFHECFDLYRDRYDQELVYDPCWCVGGTTPVGSYPAGASVYGVMDMAGNAMEWVEGVILKGGSWYYHSHDAVVFAAARGNDPRIPQDSNFGFRCVRDE